MLSMQTTYRVLRDMRRKELAVIVVISMMISSITGMIAIGSIPGDSASPLYVPHAPFRIDSNAEFASMALAEGWDGSGTEADPWVIEGYDINGTGCGYCIYVGNTTSPFTIRNCTLHHANGMPQLQYWNSALCLNNVRNGTAIGILAYSNGYAGINLESSTLNTIQNIDGWDNLVCIYLTGSNDNTISGSVLHESMVGVSVNGAGNSVYGNTIHSNDYGMGLGDTGSHVHNNTISGNDIGISLTYATTFHDISYNEILNNTFDGIHLMGDSDFEEYPTDINIYRNTLSGNNRAVYMMKTFRISLYENIISYNNQSVGLYEVGVDVEIYHNSFMENTEVPFDYLSLVSWDDGYPSGGNYWSDYAGIDIMSGLLQNIPGSDGIGDTPYVIDADSRDDYPLMAPMVDGRVQRPPIRINSNADFNAAHGVSAGNGTEAVPWVIEGYDINGTGYGYCIYVGNTTNYFIIQSCTLHFEAYNNALWFLNSTNMIIHDNAFEWSQRNGNNASSAIQFEQCDNTLIDGCIFNPGIYMCIDAHYCNYFTVENNLFDNCTFGILGFELSEWIVSNNTFSRDDYLFDYGYLWGSTTAIVMGGLNITINQNTFLNVLQPITVGPGFNIVISNNHIENSAYSIRLGQNNYEFGPENCVISNNTIIRAYCAVELTGSKYTDVMNNTLFHVLHGVFLSGNASYNRIVGNDLFSQNIDGEHGYNSTTRYGMALSADSFDETICPVNNLIVDNVFENFTCETIIDETVYGNLFYHNSYLNYSVNARDYGINSWDDGYPSGGNFWSDYTGIDIMSGPLQNIPGSDGIGDTPYVIDADSRDNYPLMPLVGGAPPHTYWFADLGMFMPRIRATTSDGTNPNGAVSRHWIRDTPQEVNTDVATFLGSPYAGMSDWIGSQGQTAANYYSMVQSSSLQTPPTNGEEAVFIMELDANVATTPKVYINSGMQQGTVPHGYIWAGSDTHQSAIADQEVLPSGSPPTTFFEVLEMPSPYLTNGTVWQWAGVSGSADVAGDTNGQIESWALLESANLMDNDGPWVEVGKALFGNPLLHEAQYHKYYCTVPYWKGDVRSLVYSQPWTPAVNAVALPDYQEVSIGQNALFDGSQSTGLGLSYSWDFGDGGTGAGITALHPFFVSGYYTATLTVTDMYGSNDSDTCTVRVTGLQDPYAIYGYVKDIDTGAKLAGCTVKVTYMDGLLGDWHTLTAVSSGTGAYSVDLLNYYNDGAVFCNVTVNPVNGKLGQNSSTVDLIGSPFGRQVDILCVNEPMCDLSIVSEDIAITYAGECPCQWDEITFNARIRCEQVFSGPDPGLTKWGPETAQVGENIMYWINYSNTGTDWAYNVIITETYPAGVTFVSATPTPNMFGNNIWNIGSISPGSSGTICVTVWVDPAASGILTNHVSMSCEDVLGNPIDREAWWNTTVVNGPFLVLDKTGPAYASPEEIIVYTISCQNIGIASAYDIWLNDTLPFGVIYYSAIPAPSVIIGDSLCWAIGSLPPGASIVITISVMVHANASGILFNCVQAEYTNEFGVPMPPAYADTSTVVLGSMPDNDLCGAVSPLPLGGTSAECTVSFYIDSILPENLIYREYGVEVAYGGYADVSCTWLSNISGDHSVIVQVTDAVPVDADLTNNIASKAFNVSEPCGRLKVKASSDEQQYELGEDDHADIIVKVTYLGSLVSDATVFCNVTDPDAVKTPVALTEVSEGIYVGSYPFTNASAGGTYTIDAKAIKAGYLDGENDDSKDKFFLNVPAVLSPRLSAVSISGETVSNSTDLAVLADIDNPEGVVSISAVLGGHGHWGAFTRPMYDDGTHSDSTAGDGIFTALFSTTGMAGTYTLDVVMNGLISDKLDAVVVSPEGMVAMDKFNGIVTSGCFYELASGVTNVTIGLNTIVDIEGINFLFVEHRSPSGGKDLEFIPSSNLAVAMTYAHIEASYVGEDIPENVSEASLQLWVYNIYTARLEPCSPSGVDIFSDLIWGDTEHFSEFKMMSAPAGTSIFTLDLAAGWNLVSVPIGLFNTDLVSILSPISGLWDNVKYYDITDPMDPWKSYRVGGTANDLFEADNTMALWVHTSSACKLPLFGVRSASTQIILHSGYNFVGYPTLTPGLTVGEALWGTGADRVEVMDQGSPTLLMTVGPNYVLSPGQGLWIHVAADTVWTVNG